MLDLGLLQLWCNSIGLPLLLRKKEETTQRFDQGFVPNPAVDIIQSGFFSTHPVSYTISNEYLCCGCVRIGDTTEYLVLGPATTFSLTRKQAQKILKDAKQSISRTDEIVSWLNHLPNCDIQRFISLLQMLDYLVNGDSNRSPIQISPSSDGKIESYPSTLDDSFIEHLSDVFEKELVSCVEYGRVERLETIFDQVFKKAAGIPVVAVDAIRAFKNICLFSTGIISRSAVKGGLDYDTMNIKTSYFLIVFEQATSYPELLTLFKSMVIEFARLAAHARRLPYSTPLIKKMHQGITAHLYERVTLATLAEQLGMNASYLSRHFKQQTGKTVTDYINEMKIEECLRLLASSDLSLAELSAQLGFTSQNYFHNVFKKVIGQTPLEYKKHIT